MDVDQIVYDRVDVDEMAVDQVGYDRVDEMGVDQDCLSVCLSVSLSLSLSIYI